MNDKPTVETLIPKPGADRFWAVRFDAKYRKTPIRVELREYIHGTLSHVIGSEYTIANPQSVADTAAEILVRVADYESVVGEFHNFGVKETADA